MTILVSGLINLETTARVESFPIQYAPVRFPFNGVRSTVSGVGYNIAKALTTLGASVNLLSLIGADSVELLVRDALAADHIADHYVLATQKATAQSVILYDESGRRAINVDLKDLQDSDYPPALFADAAAACSLGVLCNINFSRPMLAAFQRLGKPIATDVHTIASLDDAYNRDFMQAAHILFLSHEQLPDTPENVARQIWNRYGTDIIVIGMGGQGALLALKRDHALERLPAVQVRPIVNTIGAGDALFSAFVHFYNKTNDPYLALNHARYFAAYKIGISGAADGFLTESELEGIMNKAQ